MDDLLFKGNNPGAVRFGNFINYYNFHPPEARIASLTTDSNIWNCDAEISNHCLALDIGCNCGNLTNELYNFLIEKSNWNSISMLGIDIDPKLINTAKQNSKYSIEFENADIMSPNGRNTVEEYLKRNNKTLFNFIFCFSITMWIHLNFGDDGLVDFLNYLCNISKILIIEIQPWKCYRTAVRRMKKSGETFPFYSKLQMRSNVEKDIENIILKSNKFVKMDSNTTLQWDRKILIFSLK